MRCRERSISPRGPTPPSACWRPCSSTTAPRRPSDEHLARLAAGARELYDRELPDGLETRIAAAARSAREPARLRLVLTPGGEVTRRAARPGRAAPHPAPGPYLLPGGLGRHKWADRRLLAALTADAGGSTPLLVDADGAVLEAAWASVFAVEGRDTVTPPADGRILPGIHRARIAAHEEPIDLGRLEAADEVFLTSALRRVDGYRPSSARYSRA